MASITEHARKRISEKQRKIKRANTVIEIARDYDLPVFVHTSGSMPSWLTSVPRGSTPYNVLYREVPPRGLPFSVFRYLKGLGFHKLRYMKG